MPSYTYEVIQPNGKPKKGTIDATSEDAAKMELKAAGHTIVSIGLASALTKDLDINIGKIVKPKELSIFCRQFQGILNAGVTVIDAQNANIIYRGGVVSAEGAKKIDLFNISGALVCGANADQLSVSNIEKGIYVVVVTDNNGRRTAKKIAIR